LVRCVVAPRRHRCTYICRRRRRRRLRASHLRRPRSPTASEKGGRRPVVGISARRNWQRRRAMIMRIVQVASNDAFGQLLLLAPRCCSASRLFVYNNAPSFDAVVRKLVCSFWCSLCKSDNMLIHAALSCDIFISNLFFKWGVVLL